MIILPMLLPVITQTPEWHTNQMSSNGPMPLLMQWRGDYNDGTFSGVSVGERRAFLQISAIALTTLSSPQPLHAATNSKVDFDSRFLQTLLESSNIYTIKTNLLKNSRNTSPSAARSSTKKLLRTLRSKRAVFVGEHHPDGRDHLLQAALVRRLHDETGGKALAVGLEAVQRRFQPVLDDYIAGRIDELGLVKATDWETSWVWSFRVYEPVFRVCRELGIKLIALDVNSEDRARVELGGLESLEKGKLLEYVPDLEAFEKFGNTQAFHRYVSYTLLRPYELQKKYDQKMTVRTTLERTISFANFVSRQAFRDEGMASASVSWLTANPDGLLLGFIGGNHVKFGCGVPARVSRMLSLVDGSGISKAVVASVLLNPTPFDTEAELRRCDGTTIVNELCLRNDIEVQNYVIKLDYEGIGRVREEAGSVVGIEDGSIGLGLSDYLIFSPRTSR